MMRCSLPLVLLGSLPLAGCWKPESQSLLVPANTFDAATITTPPLPTASPASTEAAARVDTLGRTLLKANPQLNVQPVFRTVGAPQLEVFHVGTTDVVITEGLVRQCKDDGCLAAVLCQELGKMVREREVLAGPAAQPPVRELPIDVPIGNDSSASRGAPDQTRLAELELARYGHDNRRREAAPPPPDPQVLARTYLAKAGYAEACLDQAAGLLREADRNNTFEKQWTATGPGRLPQR
jgi:hypothetical protein